MCVYGVIATYGTLIISIIFPFSDLRESSFQMLDPAILYQMAKILDVKQFEQIDHQRLLEIEKIER